MDRLKQVDWRGLVKTATNKVKQYTLNLSPLELKVEDATNMETWGPHGSAMNEIAEACFDPEGYRQVLGVIARRLQERDEHWRMCYKALLLLEHLVKHGPAKLADDVVASMSVLDRLQRFQYKDANGRDHGANVRHRAQEIAALVSEPGRLREEREKAKANRAKYRGVSSTDMRRGGTGSSFGSGGGSDPYRSGGFDPASLIRPGEGGSRAGAASSAAATGGLGGASGFASSRGSRYEGREGGFGGGLGNGSGAFAASSSTTARADGPRSPASPPSPSTATAGATGSMRSHEDPVAATRARIEKLKVEEQSRTSDPGTSSQQKKRLTDVKVNPKIAASLGLKVAAPSSAQNPTPVEGTSGVGTGTRGGGADVDLLGGLDDESFSTPAVSTAASGSATEDRPWNAFGDDGGNATSGGVKPSSARVGDPFASLPGTRNTYDAQLPIINMGTPLGAGTAAFQDLPKTSPSSARPALPEDAFADLTGLVTSPPPMVDAARPRPRSPRGGGGGGGGAHASPSPLAVAVSGDKGDVIGEDAFADFAAFEDGRKPADTATTKDPFADLM